MATQHLNRDTHPYEVVTARGERVYYAVSKSVASRKLNQIRRSVLAGLDPKDVSGLVLRQVMTE